MEFRAEFDAGKPLMINGAIQASHSDVSLEKVGIFCRRPILIGIGYIGSDIPAIRRRRSD